MTKFPKLRFYRDRHGKWRWRWRSANGAVLADSGQGYANKRDAIRGAELVCGGVITITFRIGKGDGYYAQGHLTRIPVRNEPTIFVEVI